MAIAKPQEAMLRKPILMPSAMVSKIDKIARDRNVSFAKVVREAVDAFEDNQSEDDALMEALADTMIQTTRDVVGKIEKVEKRLDETHALLEAL